MKRLLIALLLFAMYQVPALAHGGLEDFLQNVNIQARADMNGFSAKVSAQFGVPEAQVRIVLGKVTDPADAFMVFQLGQMAHSDPDAVLQVYQAHRDRGWGVLAQELGIRPGSPEFHALKRGDLHFGPGGEEDYGPGHGHGHGPGQGHGHGRFSD